MSDDETRLDWEKDLPGFMPPGAQRQWGQPSPHLYPPVRRSRTVPITMEDGHVEYLQKILEEGPHYWQPHWESHRHPCMRHPEGHAEFARWCADPPGDGMLTGFPRDDRGNYWHPSVGAPTRHVTSKVYRAKTYRPWWQRALMWAAIILVIGATLAAAVPVAGLVCLAHCPVP